MEGRFLFRNSRDRHSLAQILVNHQAAPHAAAILVQPKSDSESYLQFSIGNGLWKFLLLLMERLNRPKGLCFSHDFSLGYLY
jgi:hypothetical protein